MRQKNKLNKKEAVRTVSGRAGEGQLLLCYTQAISRTGHAWTQL